MQLGRKLAIVSFVLWGLSDAAPMKFLHTHGLAADGPAKWSNATRPIWGGPAMEWSNRSVELMAAGHELDIERRPKLKVLVQCEKCCLKCAGNRIKERTLGESSDDEDKPERAGDYVEMCPACNGNMLIREPDKNKYVTDNSDYEMQETSKPGKKHQLKATIIDGKFSFRGADSGKPMVVNKNKRSGDETGTVERTEEAFPTEFNIFVRRIRWKSPDNNPSKIFYKTAIKSVKGKSYLQWNLNFLKDDFFGAEPDGEMSQWSLFDCDEGKNTAFLVSWKSDDNWQTYYKVYLTIDIHGKLKVRKPLSTGTGLNRQKWKLIPYGRKRMAIRSLYEDKKYLKYGSDNTLQLVYNPSKIDKPFKFLIKLMSFPQE